MMKKSYFITGTDTEVGKTTVTVALMRYFKQQGQSVVAMKPVAAGCEWKEGQYKNKDALLLQENASIKLDYQQINPYPFQLPVSPHLAGKENPVKLDVIAKQFEALTHKGDVVLVEGAGGWFAPVNEDKDIADLAKMLDIPVILVVAIRLGCINQARLTFQAIQTAGVKCVGWIAVCFEPEMKLKNENIETIKNKLPIPLLAIFPYLEKIDYALLSSCILTDKLS